MFQRTFSFITTMILVFFLGVGFAIAEEPILIGGSFPLTGPFSGTGQEMKRGVEVAIEDYNAAGGLLGRKVKLISGDVAGCKAEAITAVGERLIGAGVNMVITGYDALDNTNVRVYGAHDVIYMTGTAYHLISDAIEADLSRNWNVFDYCWDELTYAYTLMDNMFDIPEKIGWKPPNKKIALLKADLSYCIVPADLFKEMAIKRGYEFPVDEVSQFGKVDWGTTLSKIERTKPSYILLFLQDPTDTARFQQQFYERFGEDGIESLIVAQYSPGMPEYLELTGKEAAEGVIWMGAAIRTWDPEVAEFIKRFKAKFGDPPKDPYAVQTHDGFSIWAEAVKRAGCVDCYEKIAREIRETVYVGMFGTYVFNPRDQTVIYGINLLPVDWVQIRDGKHLQVFPEKYKFADFQKPPWIKK
jgi:branched-chain amino acid transport system substrate-binding protein